MPDFTQVQRQRLAARNRAMPDGGFPIRNVSDLKNAIRAYGRAKNKPAVKKWIKKRARQLGREDLLPENWRTSEVIIHYGVMVNWWRGCDVLRTYNYYDSDVIIHHGIKGMKWGIRRFQNKDGTLTSKGKARDKLQNTKNSNSKSKSYSNKVKSNKISPDIQRKIEKGKKAVVSGLKKYGPIVAKSAAITALASIGAPAVLLSIANYAAFGQSPVRTLGFDSGYDNAYTRGVTLGDIETRTIRG